MLSTELSLRLQAYADRVGAVFALSILTEPRVSYTDIVNHAREYASSKWLDSEWMKLLEFRIHIIVSAMRLLGDTNLRRMANVDWWVMGRDDVSRQTQRDNSARMSRKRRRRL